MGTVARYLTLLIRLAGVAALLLGITIWTGRVVPWLKPHMLFGGLLVAGLAVTAVLALATRTRPGMAVLLLLWSAGLVTLGLTQPGLLPGPQHWIVRVAHLLVGGIGMGLGGALAGALHRRFAGASAEPAQGSLGTEIS